MQNFTSVPFKTESTHGLTTVNGVAKFSSAGIVLEFEAKILGLITEGVKESRLALGDILDVKFKKGLFKRGAKIEIRATSLAALGDLPCKDGKLILKLQSDDFERAKAAVVKLQADIDTQTAASFAERTPVSVFPDSSEIDTKRLPPNGSKE
ncbi:MAG: hypothetical protein KA746_11150 [Pyrinomonadaceae bacterium]|nr:hypothetical protein [Pyrinomonadaceae bacterium]MBP6212631.1 hypothetical protein [Pyrinomonadaceae bacterium]